MFTLQFIAEKDRLRLLQKIYENLVDGGAFIFSEKVFSDNSKLDDMLSSIYYDFKRQSFTEKEILDKEHELRHLAKLTNEKILVQQLRSIGFRGVQPFWRNHNFVGYTALKLPKEKWSEVENTQSFAPEGSPQRFIDTIVNVGIVKPSDRSIPSFIPVSKMTSRWENLLPEEVVMSLLVEPSKNNCIESFPFEVERHGVNVSSEWILRDRQFSNEPNLQKLFDKFSLGVNEIRWGERGYYDDITSIPFLPDGPQDVTFPKAISGESRIRELRDKLFQELWDNYGDRYKPTESTPIKRQWWKFW
tara:strand:- start:608 stop:1516 length:909 start_codon:yes stop_codon:yes gene_type:complete